MFGPYARLNVRKVAGRFYFTCEIIKHKKYFVSLIDAIGAVRDANRPSN